MCRLVLPQHAPQQQRGGRFVAQQQRGDGSRAHQLVGKGAEAAICLQRALPGSQARLHEELRGWEGGAEGREGRGWCSSHSQSMAPAVRQAGLNPGARLDNARINVRDSCLSHCPQLTFLPSGSAATLSLVVLCPSHCCGARKPVWQA